MKCIDACCCALVIRITARSRAFSLHISLKLSAAADYTDGLRLGWFTVRIVNECISYKTASISQ